MRKSNQNVLTSTNEEGIERARRGNFVFILPSTIGDYIIKRRPCDLMIQDNFLMHRGYGLAVQKGSALLPKLNNILSLLKLNGYLQKLYHKWWIENNECNGVRTSKRVYRNIAHIHHPCSPIIILSMFSLITTGLLHRLFLCVSA